MSDLLPREQASTALLPEPRVRLRCIACEVAWSGAPTSVCWVCGDRGSVLSVAGLVTRSGVPMGLDFDLSA
jgi:hypothetical protein